MNFIGKQFITHSKLSDGSDRDSDPLGVHNSLVRTGAVAEIINTDVIALKAPDSRFRSIILRMHTFTPSRYPDVQFPFRAVPVLES